MDTALDYYTPEEPDCASDYCANCKVTPKHDAVYCKYCRPAMNPPRRKKG